VTTDRQGELAIDHFSDSDGSGTDGRWRDQRAEGRARGGQDEAGTAAAATTPRAEAISSAGRGCPC
jgi:hypothetical protein